MDAAVPPKTKALHKPAAAIFAPASTLLCASLLVFFVAYYWLWVLKVNWFGDSIRLVAGIRSLYADFRHPQHETLPLPGTQSVIYFPYLVAVAALGKLFHLDPFAALQFAGLTNLILFTLAVWCFFRTFSLQPRSLLPPVLFLLVMLFLRTRSYAWASETSVIMLGVIHNYPSMVGWIAALFCFSACKRYFQNAERAAFWLGFIGLLLWSVVLTHNLSGSWIFGILGVQGLMALHGGRAAAPVRRRVLALYAVMLGALLLTGVWPYFSLLHLSRLVRVREGSSFVNHHVRDFFRLYLLFALALVWLWRVRRHAFYFWGFAATLLALLFFRLIRLDYGNRYAFFQLFFAQAAVADVASFGLLVALGQARGELGQKAMAQRPWRIACGLYFLLVVGLTASAPIWRDRHIPTVGELLAMPSAHDEYYARVQLITRHISSADVVLVNEQHAWYLASITGARMVTSRYAFEVPDYKQRVADATLFLSLNGNDRDRREILKRYGVTWIILSEAEPYLLNQMSALCGAPIAYNKEMILFRAPQPGAKWP